LPLFSALRPRCCLVPCRPTMKKLRVVTIRVWRGEMTHERWTNPKLQRRTCTCEYGLQPCRGKMVGVAKRPRERSPARKYRSDSQLSRRCLANPALTCGRHGAVQPHGALVAHRRLRVPLLLGRHRRCRRLLLARLRDGALEFERVGGLPGGGACPSSKQSVSLSPRASSLSLSLLEQAVSLSLLEQAVSLSLSSSKQSLSLSSSKQSLSLSPRASSLSLSLLEQAVSLSLSLSSLGVWSEGGAPAAAPPPPSPRPRAGPGRWAPAAPASSPTRCCCCYCCCCCSPCRRARCSHSPSPRSSCPCPRCCPNRFRLNQTDPR
jgi:hypothetical protein